MKINLSLSVKFLIAVAVQLVIAMGLVVFNASLLARGAEVLLPIEPFDPRDLLRGDYVTLQYEISRIKNDLIIDESQSIKRNDIVYLVLEKKNNYWIAKSLTRNEPDQGIFIKGNVKSVYAYNSTISITYGIEQYFVPEGTGGELEKKMRSQQAFAKVVVDKNGKAILKDIVFVNALSENKDSSDLPESFSQAVVPNIKTDTDIPIDPIPTDWDISAKFDQARCNDIYLFSKEPGQTGKIYYADLNGSSDNLFKEYFGKDCCPEGSGYAETYEESGAVRKGPWVVERKYIDKDNYRILIRGASKADCSCGGDGYVKGEVVINPKNWKIVKIVKKEFNKDTRGREVYCDINQNTGVIKFVGGSSCVGCCACVDSGNIDIEVIVSKGAVSKASSSIIPAPNRNPYIKVANPNGKETFCLGERMEIGWESSGVEMVGIRLVEAAMNGSNYYYLGLNSVPASSDESGVAGKGSAVWAVSGVPAGQGYKVEIMGLGANSKIRDTSDGFFSIAPCDS